MLSFSTIMNIKNYTKNLAWCLCTLLLLVHYGQAQEKNTRWKINNSEEIIWKVNKRLPHSDNIEMAGTRVAAIISYSIDTTGVLTLNRQVFFPQLHPFIKETDPDWFIYRAYVNRHHDDRVLPKVYLEGEEFSPGPLEQVRIDGTLNVKHSPSKSGIALRRSFAPSTNERLFAEQLVYTNTSASNVKIQIVHHTAKYEELGKEGKFTTEVRSEGPTEIVLQPGAHFKVDIRIAAKKENEEISNQTVSNVLANRKNFLKTMQESLILETPNAILNVLFYFSKIRASESIYESKLGPIHSPGGGRYYVGIWANDQAEYVSPFFPYLGYDLGNQSGLNTYRAFAKEINAAYKNIRYAFEIEGTVPPFMLDRGDAAMIAYGATQYILALGNEAIAEELWPLVKWCLEYCRRQLNEAGVVQSESDEMEGRIATGTANLSTSSLYYGALRNAADLAKSMRKPSKIQANYRRRAKQLSSAIEQYFGAEVEGLSTYRYYKGHGYLRHWICLPLVVGIYDRKEGTTTALFERLWSPNGVHVEKNSENEEISKIFWDRGTLYALRGTFLAGAVDRSVDKLTQFSQERLLGERVPYVVEAFPEGNMAHLSAESALYCRLIIEGLFGIRPVGFDSFELRPELPRNWEHMALKNIKAFGKDFSIEVKRISENKTNLKITDNVSGTVLWHKNTDLSKPIRFRF